MARILVVEDTPANLALAVKLLRAVGHDVLPATSGEEGVAVARTTLPDLVLMDLGLPDMDGTQAMRALRALERTKDLCVVAFTAYAMTGDRERAMESGFDGYLSKPIDFATFTRDVEELLP